METSNETTITVRLSGDIKRFLLKEARREERTSSQLLRFILKEWMERVIRERRK